MKKTLLVVIIVIVAGAAYMANSAYKGRLIDTPKKDVTPMATETAVPTVSGVTVAVLAQHSTESDCWIVYDGSVYDVTNFLPIHPGGVQRIAQFCGKATGFEDAFSRQHGTSKVQLLKNRAGKLQGELQ